jgi:hypothetical protein
VAACALFGFGRIDTGLRSNKPVPNPQKLLPHIRYKL